MLKQTLASLVTDLSCKYSFKHFSGNATFLDISFHFCFSELNTFIFILSILSVWHLILAEVKNRCCFSPGSSKRKPWHLGYSRHGNGSGEE